MSNERRDGKAIAVFALMILLGLGLLAIPFFLTPPAFLDVALRDSVFATDLAGRSVQVTEDASGNALARTVQNSGGGFVARVGRISSGPGSFTLALDGYEPAALSLEAPPLQTVRAVVDLVPSFGRVEVSVVNAVRDQQPVTATLKEGSSPVAPEPRSVFMVDLKPGKHRLAAEAAGFCPGEREVQVQEGKVTKLKLPLSPDLTGDEIARLILDWGENPRDLDAHFRKVGTAGFPNPAHVFFQHKEGRNEARERFAILDVDHTNSQGYETITLSDKATGEYEYYVHHYAGTGTIGGSGAQASIVTRGCQRRDYSVPASCNKNVWAIARVRVQQGRVELVDQQRCETSPPLAVGGKAP
jgi:hypothetical protein